MKTFILILAGFILGAVAITGIAKEKQKPTPVPQPTSLEGIYKRPEIHIKKDFSDLEVDKDQDEDKNRIESMINKSRYQMPL